MVSKKNNVILIGGGGHARVLLDILLSQGKYQVLGYSDFKACAHMPIKYLGSDEQIVKAFKPANTQLVNGLGSVHLPLNRAKVFNFFNKAGFSFVTVVHHKAWVSTCAILGEGAQILAGAIVNTGAQIGDNVIINTLSSVDHDCCIGAHVHVAPGVTLSGDVTIGSCSHIGTGTQIIQGVTIGKQVLVGAGTLVLKNIKDKQVWMGNPAKQKRVK